MRKRAYYVVFTTLCTLFFGWMIIDLMAPSSTALGATTIIVTTTADEYNLDNGLCSLREAVVAANTNTAFGGCPAGSGMDTIYIPAGVYTLTIAGADEDEAATGDLDLREDVVISGEGVGTTIIQGNNLDRVFHIIPFITLPPTTVDVRMDNLTIAGGYAINVGAGGGGVLLEGQYNSLDIRECEIRDNQTPSAVGGGLDNRLGNLVVTNCSIVDNLAERGGGIYTDGTTEINQSLIYGNHGNVDGGGLDNGGSGETTLVNVTIAGNTSDTGSGLFNDSTLHIVNSTIVENTGIGDGVSSNGIIYFKNTIVALNGENGVVNCGGNGSFNSNGHNLENADTCNFTSPGDQPNTDPLFEMGGLKDHGGGTLTYALQSQSPAIDSGDNTDCATVDQRGFHRPVDGDDDGTPTCDIGAFEFFITYTVFMPVIIR